MKLYRSPGLALPALVLAFLAALPAQAVETCPLSNPLYKDLLTAAAALERAASLPESCRGFQDRLQESAREVKRSAEQLQGIKGNEFAQPNLTTQYMRGAVNGMAGISKTISQMTGPEDKCMRALFSKGDYAIAFVDSVNSMTSMLGAYAGPYGVAAEMGANVIGSAVKMFTYYLDSIHHDMSKADLRQAFIGNACSFYRFNQTMRSLLNVVRDKDLPGETDETIARLRNELAAIEASAPAVPTPAPQVEAMALALSADQKFLSGLSATFASMASSPSFACYFVRAQVEQAVKGEFPTPAFERLEVLLAETEAKGTGPSAHRRVLEFARQITQVALYPSDDTSAQTCASRSESWLKAVGAVLMATDTELSAPGRRDLSDTEAYKARVQWEKTLAEKKAELNQAIALQKHHHDLAQGASIDVSELFDTRDQVRRTLFGEDQNGILPGGGFHQSPAESWLKHKLDATDASLKDFRALLPRIKKSWLRNPDPVFGDPQIQKNACATIENALITWNTAAQHVEATRLFCGTFSDVINDAANPGVSSVCLGEFNRKGYRKKSSQVENFGLQINALKVDVDALLAWMGKAGCAMPAPLGPVLN